ncbi:MAG TPA: biotin--[acetyl-CoA-carboxylase] ligase [Pyrinomonadaceae bacterium]|nr:biotin--[acetyl-CoA-carboxylase] ligase [Pyrinomonadaceae bacterium]
MNFTILRFDSLASTNDEAIRQAKLGAPEGLCIVARRQTAGRGRRERNWYSPADAGLYFSLVLRPGFEIRKFPLITLAAAVAISDCVLESCNLKTDIKWANDIHANGKKLSGILAETVETANKQAVILGIGINLRKEAIAPELSDIATSIENETGIAPDVENLLGVLTNKLKKYYYILEDSGGSEQIIEAWSARSSYAFGKLVRVTLENESFVGTTRGLEADGALRVGTESGLMKIVHAGDVVSLRRGI